MFGHLSATNAQPMGDTAIPRPQKSASSTFLTLALLVAGSLGFGLGAHSSAQSLGQEQAAYTQALREFRALLAERRAQQEAKRALPERAGQALYLARNKMISTYKDLTDAVPGRIGRANRFGIPPAYFDADNEPLLEQYGAIFNVMQVPPADAQASATPFKDVANLGRAIARGRGLEGAAVDAAGRISLGIFFAETNGVQNLKNARTDAYMGSLQTGVAEDANGRRAWMALRPKIAALDPAVIARDDAEMARVGSGDQRFNHWTAVRNGLMNAHVDLFARLPAIMRTLPDPIDQMKLFQLIQLIPTPTRRALASDDFLGTRVSEPRIMGYLRNNSIFSFGTADRARTSANFREILDAMWLYTDKFERARAKYEEIKAEERGRAR